MAEAREGARFHTTRWSLIVAAGDRGTPRSRLAVSELCQMYWYPLYAFVRRRGEDPEHAADLIQGFFAELIDGKLLRSADPAKGRFRSYLLSALKHYISRQAAHDRAQKRGGGAVRVSLSDAESRYPGTLPRSHAGAPV